MLYPQSPWFLYGFGYQTIQMIKVDRVRAVIPPDFEIVSVLPNYTIGGICLSSYKTGSTLEYNELIVISALVNYQGKIGIWISHIYVDNAISVAGGQEIWGLPKELAQFNWKHNQQGCQVSQGDRPLYSLQVDWRLPLWRQAIAGQAWSTLGTQIMLFQGQATARCALVGGVLEIPPTSPFAYLELTKPAIIVAGADLELKVDQPESMGQRQNK